MGRRLKQIESIGNLGLGKSGTGGNEANKVSEYFDFTQTEVKLKKWNRTGKHNDMKQTIDYTSSAL